jgi:hypothetical protein
MRAPSRAPPTRSDRARTRASGSDGDQPRRGAAAPGRRPLNRGGARRRRGRGGHGNGCGGADAAATAFEPPWSSAAAWGRRRRLSLVGAPRKRRAGRSSSWHPALAPPCRDRWQPHCQFPGCAADRPAADGRVRTRPARGVRPGYRVGAAHGHCCRCNRGNANAVAMPGRKRPVRRWTKAARSERRGRRQMGPSRASSGVARQLRRDAPAQACRRRNQAVTRQLSR